MNILYELIKHVFVPDCTHVKIKILMTGCLLVESLHVYSLSCNAVATTTTTAAETTFVSITITAASVLDCCLAYCIGQM